MSSSPTTIPQARRPLLCRGGTATAAIVLGTWSIVPTPGVLPAAHAGHQLLPGEHDSVNRLVLHADRPVLEPGERTTIRLWGYYDDSWALDINAFETSVLADAGGRAVLDQPRPIAPYAGPGTTPGEVGPWGVRSILGGQLCCPFVDCYWIPPTSPGLLWEAELTAPPADEPQTIELRTQSEEYLLFVHQCPPPTSVIDTLQEARLAITVTPCRVDLDMDGRATLLDALVFMNAFEAGLPIADFDFDGQLTVFDFLAFQHALDRGCPQ
ncbi:MAG: hypothetical protein KatS3mg103_1333 [Phycisphaerales bacterium]|nr:MAG: hypothetical protein KatS3mg103_1333 [Phycisphaerales bacterium]